MRWIRGGSKKERSRMARKKMSRRRRMADGGEGAGKVKR